MTVVDWSEGCVDCSVDQVSVRPSVSEVSSDSEGVTVIGEVVGVIAESARWV